MVHPPKAADIADETVLALIRELRQPTTYGSQRYLGVPRSELEDRLASFPGKVVQAKTRSMMKRGLLDGCDCGCGAFWLIVADEGQSDA